MSLDRYDVPNGSYTSSIPRGTAAFRKVIAQHFGYARTEVVRDRSRCAGKRSEHCECGAIDAFTTDPVKGRTLFDWCVSVADRLGVQSVIFLHREIGFGNPDERHREKADHMDHVHIGLNRWARLNLTEEMVRALLPGQEDDMAQVPQAEWEQMKRDVAAIKGAVLIGRGRDDPQYPEPIQLDDYVREQFKKVFEVLDELKAK